jgi:hypothetical protein
MEEIFSVDGKFGYRGILVTLHWGTSIARQHQDCNIALYGSWLKNPCMFRITGSVQARTPAMIPRLSGVTRWYLLFH